MPRKKAEPEELEVTASQLQTVQRLVQQQLEAEAAVAEAEEMLKQKKKALATIEEDLLPEFLKTNGLEELRLSDGTTVKVKEDISVSIPKENLPGICDWLREQELDDIIAHTIVVTIPKGSEATARRIVSGLKQLDLPFSDGESVNTATLKAVLREQLEKGLAISLSFFGAYQWKKSVIKLPK